MSLYKNGASIGFIDTGQLFELVCSRGQLTIAKFLLPILPEYMKQHLPSQIGVCYVNYGAFISACSYGHLEIVKWFVQREYSVHGHWGRESLSTACANGHLGVVVFLLEEGADVHAQDERVFIEACCGGHLPVVKYLKLCGAIIDARENLAFLKACRYGHLDIVQWFHLQGTDLRFKDDKGFRVACKYNRLKVAKWLAQQGEDVPSRMKDWLYATRKREWKRGARSLSFTLGIIPWF